MNLLKKPLMHNKSTSKTDKIKSFVVFIKADIRFKAF